MNDFFNDIIGHQRVKEILSGFSDANQIPHALLFTGIEGTGKEFTAINFAKVLNTKNLAPEEKKNISSRISQLNEPYIKYIIPLPRGKNETEADSPTDKLSADEIEILLQELKTKIENPYYKVSIPKANIIKINSIRDIKKFLSLDFSEVPFRFIIISDAHLMNEAAQNALLKNLEEPPDGVVFVLVTSYPERLRETIRSRCWNIHFDPLSDDQLSQILTEYFNITKRDAQTVAPFAGGSTTLALKLYNLDIENLKEKTISILRYSFGKKYNSAFNEINSLLSDRNAENIQLIIKMLITWLTDLQKHKFKLDDDIFYKEHKITLEKFHTKFPGADSKELVYRLDRLSSYVKNNININLLAANIIFEISSLTTNPSV